MDTSYWLALNNVIEFKNIDRLAWGKYAYHIKIGPVHGKYLRKYLKCNEKSFLEAKKHVSWIAQYGGLKLKPDDYNLFKYIDNLDPALISRLKITTSGGLSVYATSEDDLKAFMKDYPAKNANKVYAVYSPSSDEHLAVIKQGIVFRKRKPKHKYRLRIVDGIHQFDMLYRIEELIANHEDTTANSKFVNACDRGYRKRFYPTRTGIYIYNAHINTNDTSIVTMLNIMYPGFITRITEFVHDATINTQHIQPEETIDE